MNLPGHKVHCILSGYGRLLLPLGTAWLGWFREHGFRITRRFHNCSATGIH